jgi:hypothetical protein
MKIENVEKYFLDDVEVLKEDIPWEAIKGKIIVEDNTCKAYTGKLSTRFKGKKMEKREFITLTVISSVLKDEVKKKVLGIASVSKKDSNGKDLSFYEELGITPPDELLDSNDDYIEIKEEDYDEVRSESRIRPEQITFMVNEEKKGSTIYLEIDYKLTVEETVEEIEEKIKQVKYGI